MTRWATECPSLRLERDARARSSDQKLLKRVKKIPIRPDSTTVLGTVFSLFDIFNNILSFPELLLFVWLILAEAAGPA